MIQETRIGSLCSGYEGLGMAVMDVLGGELAWVADNDPGASAILAHRFPSVPNLGDITATDWTALERVDVLTAGFPCQDVSCAGGRAGLRAGNRTGVWAHVARAIDALRPSLVVLENVRGLLSAGADSDLEWCPGCMGEVDAEHLLRASGAVLGDLADLLYDTRGIVVSASDIGAPHRRERVFILAWPAADSASVRRQIQRSGDFGRGGGTAVAPDRWIPAQHDGLADQGSSAHEDADRPTGGERWEPAPGQAPGRWPRADTSGPGGAPAADAEHGPEPERSRDTRRQEGERASVGSGSECGRGDAPADTDSTDAGPQPAGSGASPSARADDGTGWGSKPGSGIGGSAPADTEHDGLTSTQIAGSGEGPQPGQRGPRGLTEESAGDGGSRIGWGAYGPAIARWEAVLGRPAPRPTEPGRTGERLSPRFVEWLMGLPDGWVTDVPGLSRNAQLKALGNGVVPQQAAAALRLLLPALERAA